MLDQCRRLSEIATAHNINGLDIQHASICPARCWFNRKGMVYSAVRHEIRKTHLEETLSFLHSPSSSRSSLSLDLAEIFKPILTDRIIFKVIRKNMLKESWFEKHGKVCLLTEVGRKNIVEQFALFCDQKEEGFSLRERMHKQAISLERHILGISKFKPYIRRV